MIKKLFVNCAFHHQPSLSSATTPAMETDYYLQQVIIFDNYIAYNIIVILGEGVGDLISFDLSSPGSRHLLSKHWKEEKRDHHPLQDLKEDICTGNIMEVVERELQKYLKQRYCKQLIILNHDGNFYPFLESLIVKLD